MFESPLDKYSRNSPIKRSLSVVGLSVGLDDGTSECVAEGTPLGARLVVGEGVGSNVM